ncbi:MAG: iron ABC transporter permease [Gammaproteobacteria bacterium]|nr:iron ABC transporter permease [Gammaproteobacteria bacterium]
MIRASHLTMLLLLAAPASIAFALSMGSADLNLGELRQALIGDGTSLDAAIVRELRLPRALSAFAVGGLLALSGALLQVLLRNPLADPYILGVSGGAAAAALLSILLGLGSAWVMGSAFAGSLVSTFLVFSLSRLDGAWTQTRLLLTGVVVAAGWGALISFLLVISPDGDLHTMLFWLMGDMSRAAHPLFANAILLAGLALSLGLARSLNLLARGDLAAAALGENPARVRVSVYFIASLLTAAAVTVAGSIGFVGLIIPHIIRLLTGADHRSLLPNTVLLGGCFLVLADTVARTAVVPIQLPVGVITALLGVPVFLFLLTHTRNP